MWPWNGPPRRIGALVVGGNGFGCRLMSIKVERLGLRQSIIPKSGSRFSDKIMLKTN